MVVLTFLIHHQFIIFLEHLFLTLFILIFFLHVLIDVVELQNQIKDILVPLPLFLSDFVLYFGLEGGELNNLLPYLLE